MPPLPDACSLGGRDYCLHQFGVLQQQGKDQEKKLDALSQTLTEFVERYNKDQLRRAAIAGESRGGEKVKHAIATGGISICTSGVFLAFLKAVGIVRLGN